MRIVMKEKASYWLVKFGGQLNPFQSCRRISCIFVTEPQWEEDRYLTKKKPPTLARLLRGTRKHPTVSIP